MTDGKSETRTLSKLAEVDRVLAQANYVLCLQGVRAVPCQWKIEAFLRGSRQREGAPCQ
jgi:hypothetical protein